MFESEALIGCYPRYGMILSGRSDRNNGYSVYRDSIIRGSGSM